jgi:PhnB protein
MSTIKNVPEVQPYLFFNGRCEEALEFYHHALGAEVMMLMRYKDCPDHLPPDRVAPGFDNKIMHARLGLGNATLMAADDCSGGSQSFQGFSLSITAPTVPDAERFFAALSDGGQVQMPLAKTFFSPMFGMVADRFGVHWMVMVEP